jgi:RND family efflux transporter MFP subunit
MKTFLLHVLLPLLVLAGAGGVAWWLIATRKPVPVQVPVVQPPLVRTVVVTPQALQLVVSSQGTVAARTVTTLAAEVAGRVLAVAPTLRDGAFFAAGDELLRIDAVEHAAAVAQAKAESARAARVVHWERAEAAAAVAEWQKLNAGPPPPLVAREHQVAEALAVQQAALAAVERAEHALANCVVKAPYAGRVLHASVHVGDFVARGTVLGKVHALDAVEVALPLPDAELRFLDLPRRPGDTAGTAVRLHAEFGGTTAHWAGRIVRTAGELDPKTRMVHAIAEVEAPFAGAMPLVPGMFVAAEIDGQRLDGAVVLPRASLRDDGHVFVVADEVLRWRRVEVLRAERDRVVLRAGVAAGERVLVQDLEAPTDGMRVRVAPEEGGR